MSKLAQHQYWPLTHALLSWAQPFIAASEAPLHAPQRMHLLQILNDQARVQLHQIHHVTQRSANRIHLLQPYAITVSIEHGSHLREREREAAGMVLDEFGKRFGGEESQERQQAGQAVSQ
jgi:hypothetical protein